jgi:hypothetical protein
LGIQLALPLSGKTGIKAIEALPHIASKLMSCMVGAVFNRNRLKRKSRG